MKKILATSILLTVFVTAVSSCGHKQADQSTAQTAAVAAKTTEAETQKDCGCDEKTKAQCMGGCTHDEKKDSKDAGCTDCKDHKEQKDMACTKCKDHKKETKKTTQKK